MTVSPALAALCGAVAGAAGHPAPREPRGTIDWEAFLALAARHQVNSHVAASGWAERLGAPEEVRAELAARLRRQTFFTLNLARVQRLALDALHAAEVPALVLKGSVLAEDGFGGRGVRAAMDVDLLVPADGVGTAVAALRAAGFDWHGWRRPEDPDRPLPGPDALDRMADLPLLRDVTLVRDGVEVELHWRLFENPHLLPVEPSWFTAPRLLDLDGGPIATLPLADHWRYVLVHGTRHLWSLMKWPADVAALALRQPGLVRPERLDEAGPGVRRSVATGLIVAEACFGPFLAPGARAWARGVDGTGVLVRRSLAALAAGEDRAKRVAPGAVLGEVAPRLAASPVRSYRREELRLLLLAAGRAHDVDDPGPAELLGGPLRWALRTGRRHART